MFAFAQALAAIAAPGVPADIVVTASRTDEAPVVAVSRVEGEDIARLQPVSLLEALDEVAGVRAFSTGGAGGGTYLSVRGGEPNFTLVSIEGIRVNNPTNTRGGAFDLGQIDPSLVEAVDVVRGAGSAVHGSDALSGLVSIRLRSPSAAGGGGRLSVGSEGELGVSGYASASGLLVAGGWFDSGELDEGSDLRRHQALARGERRIGGFDARAIALHARSDRATFPEDSGGPLLAVNRERETGESRLWAGAVSLRRDAAAAVRPNLSLSWSRQAEETDTPFIAPGALDGVPAITADTRFDRLEAIGDVAFDRGPVEAVVGAALLREEGRSRGTIDFGFPLPTDFALERTTRSGFAEATVRPTPAVALNVAGRVDDVSGGGTSWTGRAGARVEPSPGVAVFASVGEGYKQPSFFALGHPLIGNPALRPERSVNAEAGVEYRAAGWWGRLTVFRNRFRDLIDFDPESFTNVNRARVNVQGVESELRVQATEALSLSGELTYLDVDSETPLRTRPRWQGSARATWRASEKLDLTAALRGNSDFWDSSVPTGLIRSDGHVEADFGVRYRLTPALRLDAALRNLTDSRHEDAVGFPATGRHLRASLSASF